MNTSLNNNVIDQPNLNDNAAWEKFCQAMDEASLKLDRALDFLEVALAANDSLYLIPDLKC